MSLLSSAEKNLIKDTAKGFLNELLASIPVVLGPNDVLYEGKLKNLLQFKRSTTVEEVLLKTRNLSEVKKTAILTDLNVELQTVIDFVLAKNENHIKHLVAASEPLENIFYEGFRTISEVHLLRNPYLRMEELGKFLQNAKVEVIKSFDDHWRPGNAEFQMKRREDLERKLERLQEEIEENHRKFLQGPVEREKKSFAEMERGLYDWSHRLQRYTASMRKYNIMPKSILEQQILEIVHFIDGNYGNFGVEKHRKIHEELLQILEGARYSLRMADGNLFVENAFNWAQNVDLRIKNCFQGIPQPEMQQQQQHQPQLPSASTGVPKEEVKNSEPDLGPGTKQQMNPEVSSTSVAIAEKTSGQSSNPPKTYANLFKENLEKPTKMAADFNVKAPVAATDKVTPSENETAPQHLPSTGNVRRPWNMYPDENRLFVGNLPHSITVQDMKEIFSKFGEVAEVRIQKPTRKRSGVTVPFFCFVVFEDAASVQLAMQKKGNIFMRMCGGQTRRLNIETIRPNKCPGSFSHDEPDNQCSNRMGMASGDLRSYAESVRRGPEMNGGGSSGRGGMSGRGGVGRGFRGSRKN